MSGFELLLNIAGGVALLLWATRMIRTGIMRAYGAELRRLIVAETRANPVVGTEQSSGRPAAAAAGGAAQPFCKRALVERARAC